MINISYRLVAPKIIRADFIDETLKPNDVVIRPLYLSICAADQRYYTGKRDKKALEEKLPMALIHEAVGEVVYDPKDEFKKGSTVVMIPNTPTEKSQIIRENYLRSTKFRGSGFDGFLQNYVFIDRSRIVEFNDIDLEVSSLLELVSVIMNAVYHFEKHKNKSEDVLGVWGNGNLGFIMSLILKNLYPKSKIVMFGTNPDKLKFFTFVDEIHIVTALPDNLKIDHAFECVGEIGAPKAIEQIIDIINPQGTISLLGVSENPVPINTRMILEKGLYVIGNSRSGYDDFKNAVELLEKNKFVQEELKKIISSTINIRNIDDIHKAFENDLGNRFKTILKWEM